MIRWIEIDAMFRNKIILYVADENEYSEVVDLDQHPVILQNDLPRTEEEIELFFMLNPVYGKGIFAKTIRKLSKEQINWQEGEALSIQWGEYMVRSYNKGKLSKWG